MSFHRLKHQRWPIPALLSCLVLLGAPLQATQHEEAEDSHQESSHEEAAHEESQRKLGLDSQRSWFFVSYLGDDEAETLGLEFESYFNLGSYEVKNIS